MATTYTVASVGDEGLNQARFQLGDVGHIKNDAGQSVWLLQDEEITALVDAYGYPEGVAKCADSCITRVAQQPDVYEDEGKARVEWKSRVDAWKYLARTLRSQIGTTDQENQVPVTALGSVTNRMSGQCNLGISSVS